MQPQFFNRDLSWLTFNGRVLQEAENPAVPLLDRISFLSIYSSNLDEFYRVRMPVLRALEKLHNRNHKAVNIEVQANAYLQAQNLIQVQQERYGQILREEILPQLQQNHIQLLYNLPLPQEIRQDVTDYFLGEVLAFLQPVEITDESRFFPENNKLYFLVLLQQDGKEKLMAVNIPSDELPRFHTVGAGEETYIVFLDDVIRYHLDKIFTGTVTGCYSFKVTRDADLDIQDEYNVDLAEAVERQLNKRDFGLATRFLYQPGLPLRALNIIAQLFNLKDGSLVAGGMYHNLRDLSSFPVKNPALSAPKWPALRPGALKLEQSLLDSIGERDFILHPPYQDYHAVLRFFNEAAIRPDVQEIYVTLYRVASDSKIVNALISAAKNGKQVHVMIELKARFDEANNVKWAKKLKAAGAKLIYSVTALKVHAKIALVKLASGERTQYRGLLATGNFNENTARFYTDHVLFTARHHLLREMELLFLFLARREKPSAADLIPFQHLLVAQFNLQKRFLELIDEEIALARQGKPAYIHIKMNNLEEEVLINKLYEASQAGVKIKMLVRSICRLIPGVPGMSENITVTRIIDRYLEHGRIFVFGNQGEPKIYMGSADWMNRNVYHRIEVCFPVEDTNIREEMLQLLDLQLRDNQQAVRIDEQLNNIPVEDNNAPVRSQQQIYELLKSKPGN
ncbi:polyphosphate kinase 1 [Mucilaginibacter sp. Bleaf8]|uniref:polyphosphate kinase 1 n=1 Tax=Mucilaginibacter sp. Bleaf8 TaxID=2834430 RepID=UPI001BD0D903|nr:polyphosphate kinase 1 [Mucilaginibacter sp. Bleaf8]MBS7564634.1 polyphosphate kinase 1 [Mucilaginibacter sp. Bleaf8]